MIPILWRYLFIHFFKVFCFCVVAFIAVLLTTRLQEIAHFAALGAQAQYIFLFALYQIPYVLPIAIPISCLISTMILVQRFSITYELTALRASGIALRHLFTPIMLVAACLSLLNLFIVSELATSSHMRTRMLEQELRSINPLMLLENRRLSKLKGIYVNSLGNVQAGVYATNVVVAFPNAKNGRLNLLLAKDLETISDKLIGKQITVINCSAAEQQNQFDHLFIEHMQQNITPVTDFTYLLKNQGLIRLHTDYLKLSLLLMHTQINREALQQQKSLKPIDPQKIHLYSRTTTRCLSEILRRLSIGLAPLTFTLMGAAFGISIGRRKSYRRVMGVIILATLYLVCYFMGKGLDYLLLPATLLYLVPHGLICICAARTLQKISKGIE